MVNRRCLLVAAFLAVTVASPPVSAQFPGGPVGTPGAGSSRLVLHVHTFNHRSAKEALEVVRPLLTPRGAVNLGRSDNTLEIRDTVPALARILPMLRSFDRAPGMVELEIMLVRAGSPVVSPQVPGTRRMPPALAERLRNLLRYDDFHLIARAAFESLEGEEVIYDMGGGYALRFQLGRLMPDRKIKLNDFRLFRAQGNGQKELIHTNVTLWVDMTVALGLARSEESRTALMVVMTAAEPRRPSVVAPSERKQ